MNWIVASSAFIVFVAAVLALPACAPASQLAPGAPAEIEVTAVSVTVSPTSVPGGDEGRSLPPPEPAAATLADPEGEGPTGRTGPDFTVDVPTATPTPVPQGVVIASAQLPIPGRRVYVEGQMEITEVPGPINGGSQTLTVRLHNPEFGPIGAKQSRGVIDFGKWIVDGEQLDSYVDVPTIDGALRLHLNRDGTLQLTEDDGPYL